MDILKMRKVLKSLSFSAPRVTKNSTSVPKNKKMSMTFKISNQDVHAKQTNQKSFQTKRQHCCDPQCSSNISKYISISVLFFIIFVSCFVLFVLHLKIIAPGVGFKHDLARFSMIFLPQGFALSLCPRGGEFAL